MRKTQKIMKYAQMKYILYILIIFLSFISCSSKVHFVNGTFEELLKKAKKENKYLCVISTRNDCGFCNRFSKTFVEYTFDNKINNNFIFCQLDEMVSGNEFFNRIFYNYVYPSTYIFNPKGKLVTFFIGPKEQEELKTLFSLYLQAKVPFGPYPVKLKTNDARAANFFFYTYNAFRIYSGNRQNKDSVLKAKQLIEQSLAIESYFYNTYLAAKIYETMGTHDKALFYADKALKYHGLLDMYLYHSLYNELKQISDPNILKNDAYAQVDKFVYDYGQILPQSKNIGLFKIRNTGTAPLIIFEVKGSCGCTMTEWTKSPILPSEEGIVKITYTAIDQGVFSKTAFVYSNASNTVVYLKIKGMVKNE
jgi:hypothetical protein